MSDAIEKQLKSAHENDEFYKVDTSKTYFVLNKEVIKKQEVFAGIFMMAIFIFAVICIVTICSTNEAMLFVKILTSICVLVVSSVFLVFSIKFLSNAAKARNKNKQIEDAIKNGRLQFAYIVDCSTSCYDEGQKTSYIVDAEIKYLTPEGKIDTLQLTKKKFKTNPMLTPNQKIGVSTYNWDIAVLTNFRLKNSSEQAIYSKNDCVHNKVEKKVEEELLLARQNGEIYKVDRTKPIKSINNYYNINAAISFLIFPVIGCGFMLIIMTSFQMWFAFKIVFSILITICAALFIVGVILLCRCFLGKHTVRAMLKGGLIVFGYITGINKKIYRNGDSNIDYVVANINYVYCNKSGVIVKGTQNARWHKIPFLKERVQNEVGDKVAILINGENSLILSEYTIKGNRTNYF